METETLIFDNNGYLFPYDILPTDWEVFVNTFGYNACRAELLADYQDFISTLCGILRIDHRQWVDGSFVSQREKPGDIDVVVFVPHTHFGNATDQLKQLKKEWEGRIDCYFVETFPIGHQRYEIGRADELDWYHFLHTDRRKRPKGILELHVDYGNQ